MKKYKRHKKNRTVHSNNNSAIIYVRVSSREQLDGTSLEMQERECLAYCERLKINPHMIFREEGESAKSAERTEFLKAIDYCKKQQVGYFIVWKLDRFARNASDHLTIQAILQSKGTRLISVTEPIEDSATGKLLETMLAAIAEFDNEVRSNRCSSGLYDRIRAGINPYKPPVGYICERNKSKNQKKTTPDPIHPVLFPMIRKVLLGYMNQRYSQKDIVRVLNESGYAEVAGKPADYNLVNRILRNCLDYYAGQLYCSVDDAYYTGKHQAMITLEEKAKIIAVRDGLTIRGVRRERHNPEFPLRRTVFCGSCGKAFTGSSSTGRSGKQYPSYHCYNKECSMNHRTIPKEKLESEFLALLDQIKPTERFMTYFEDVVVLNLENANREAKGKLAKYEVKLDEIRKRRSMVMNMTEAGVYTLEDAKQRISEIETELAVATIEMNEQTANVQIITIETEYFKQAINDIPKLWLDLSPAYRARFQKILFPEGLGYTQKGGFRTALLGCIYKLNSELEACNFYKVDLERKEWLQIFREYMRMQKLAKDFISGLELSKGTFGYPLQGTNWSGLLGEAGSPDCVFVDQIREAVLHI